MLSMVQSVPLGCEIRNMMKGAAVAQDEDEGSGRRSAWYQSKGAAKASEFLVASASFLSRL